MDSMYEKLYLNLRTDFLRISGENVDLKKKIAELEVYKKNSCIAGVELTIKRDCLGCFSYYKTMTLALEKENTKLKAQYETADDLHSKLADKMLVVEHNHEAELVKLKKDYKDGIDDLKRRYENGLRNVREACEEKIIELNYRRGGYSYENFSEQKKREEAERQNKKLRDEIVQVKEKCVSLEAKNKKLMDIIPLWKRWFL